MNGPQHYREAERRVTASDWQRQQGDMECAMHELAAAQVHATLALTAATVDCHGASYNYEAWTEATS